MKNVQEKILSDSNVLSINKNLKKDAEEGVLLVVFGMFTYLLSNYEKALDYFQITGEDDYPGMNLYIVPIHSEPMENSFTMLINCLSEEMKESTKKEAKEYISNFRENKETETLYHFIQRTANSFFKNEDLKKEK